MVLRDVAQHGREPHRPQRRPVVPRHPGERVVVVDRRHAGQQPHPGYRLDDVAGSVYPPVQRRSRTPHHCVRPLRLDPQPVERVELQFTGRGVLHNPAQQRDAVLPGQVHGQALTDRQHRTVTRNLGEPARVGNRGGDDVVVVAGRVQLPAQFGDVRIVDVVPLDTCAGIQPEEASIQPAAQMQHNGLRLHGQELACPIVEVRGAGGHRRRVRRCDRGPFPVVVDPVGDRLGVAVAEDRLLAVGVQRLGVERGEHRLRRSGQVDVKFLGHVIRG